MWSGPRNISTAMMRAWGNRPDTFVCDEPLYAHYLAITGLPHPGRDEVVTHHETDWRKVVAWLTGPIPQGKTIFFQKHMAHHLLPGMDDAWLDQLTHAFLIRDPREMLLSLIKVTPHVTLADTGLVQQIGIMRRQEQRTGQTPPILDARDVLEHPREMLSALCDRLGVAFVEEMLAWPAGPRPTDGIWAKHWYAAVEKSTGFETYRPRTEALPVQYRALLEEATSVYRLLHERRIPPC
ncbi:MAG: hypothetical protein FLDDKLPJ_01021 [Phycisphaerae bacterium]|nr:hypothetical protein [Phycisphaerae bacterium]